MTAFDLKDLWTAGGVLLGIQVACFSWRTTREVTVAGKGDITWLPPADILNLLSLALVAIGMFAIPLMGVADVNLARRMLGVAVILFAGHPFALAGHYEMFNPTTKRSFAYFPVQERIVVGIVCAAAALYSWLAWSR